MAAQVGVVASWLLDLTAQALAVDPQLSTFEGRVSDSGEGRWTIAAAIDEGVPVPVLSTALFSRFARGAGPRAPTRSSRRCAPASAATTNEGDQPMTTTDHGSQPPADALVLFGATGDLAKRKLFPALYHLERRGR